jgi:anti-sigma factor ChrR (cupin superfamily)
VKEDVTPVFVDMHDAEWMTDYAPGLEVLPLHRFNDETVALIRWAPNTAYEEHTHDGGEEVFVIEGSFSDEFGDYPAGSWVRSPDQSSHNAFTRDEGALLYIKGGHLPKHAD